MFCTKCGAQSPDGTAFCTGCGAPLGDSATPETPVEAPKKNTKGLVIGAIAAVLVIVLLIVAVSSLISTPKGVVKDLLKAEFKGDLVKSYKCEGVDYDAYMMDYLEDKDTDLDEIIESRVDYLESDSGEDALDDIGMDAEKWAKKFDKVETEKQYLKLTKQYSKEYSKRENKEYDSSYKIKEIESEKLSGKDLREAEDYYENWYESQEDDYGELIFDEDQAKDFYEVKVKIEVEFDGDSDTARRTYLVVKTSKGCFVISENWG